VITIDEAGAHFDHRRLALDFEVHDGWYG
jgi:hypothetical protein